MLITTQQDQTAQDATYAADVRAILPKPFTVLDEFPLPCAAKKVLKF